MKHVWVIALDEFNLRHNLSSLSGGEYQFHELLSREQVQGGSQYAVDECLRLARELLDETEDPVDGIVAYWDFPVSLMAAILCRERGLPSAPLEAVFQCEHKYWSRLKQREVIDAVPAFDAIDPFHEETAENLPLEYPFWMKPVKAFLSQLGFRIESDEDLHKALDQTRQKILRFAEPFNHLLEYIDVPEEVAGVDGRHCLAEGIIGGRQCTLEGYCHEGKAHVYGVVDSFVYDEAPTFQRLQYPSLLPEAVQKRMGDLAGRVMEHIGFAHGPFNVEFYWDEETDRLWLLEINPRISQSHSNLFKKVDGVSQHKVMTQLALDEQPEMPSGGGEYGAAAKYMLRTFVEDGRVTSVPGPEDIKRVEDRFPDTIVKVEVKEGTWLSDYPDQDSYSFLLAEVFMGAKDDETLQKQYAEAVEMLPFEVEEGSREV